MTRAGGYSVRSRRVDDDDAPPGVFSPAPGVTGTIPTSLRPSLGLRDLLEPFPTKIPSRTRGTPDGFLGSESPPRDTLWSLPVSPDEPPTKVSAQGWGVGVSVLGVL